MSSDICLFLWLLVDTCVCRELMDKPIDVSWIAYVLPPRKYARNMRGRCSVDILAAKSGVGVDCVGNSLQRLRNG